MNRTSSIPFIKILGATVLTISALGYAVYQTKDFVRGPVVGLTTPADGETFREPILSLSGTAQRVSFVSLNGRPIFTDKEGAWSEQVILHAGYNVITVTAKDRFGRETTVVRRVILAEAPAPPPPPSPTSTSTEPIHISSIIKPLL